MSLGLASDPVLLATFDRVCDLVMARRSGMTLRQLAQASALARGFVAGDQERIRDMAARLKVDPGEIGGKR